MEKRWSSKLILLLLAVLIKQFAWSSFTPLWQTPDEQSHFAQVQINAELNKPKLPAHNNLSQEIYTSEIILGTLRDGSGNNKYTYHPEYNTVYTDNANGKYEWKISNLSADARKNFVIDEATGYPPAYYQASSWVYRLFSRGTLFDRVFAVRFFTGLTLVLITFLTYRSGELLFGSKQKAFVLAIILSFAPMVSFVHSGVSSDTLFNLLGAGLIYCCLSLVKKGISWPYIFASLAITALGFQTKQQANIFLPIFFLAIIFSLIVHRPSLAKVSLRHLFAALIIILISVILFIPLGTAILSGFKLIPEPGPLNSAQISLPSFINFTINHTFREVIPWYWGVFRWLSLGLPPILRKVFSYLMILSFVGFAWYLVSQIRNKKYEQFVISLFLLCAFIIYFGAITIFDYHFYASHNFSFGIQGRYFFPTLLPQMAIFLIGLESFFPEKLHHLIEEILTIGMIFASAAVFFWVIGSYYSINLPIFFIQASQYKPGWLKFPVNMIILLLYLIMSLLTTSIVLKKNK